MAAPVVFKSLSDKEAGVLAQEVVATFNANFEDTGYRAELVKGWMGSVSVKIAGYPNKNPITATDGVTRISDTISVAKFSISIPKDLYMWMEGANAAGKVAFKDYFMNKENFPGASQEGGYRRRRRSTRRRASHRKSHRSAHRKGSRKAHRKSRQSHKSRRQH
jgi:hypothetical protein